MRPVCVRRSEWDYTLERDDPDAPWSVRVGLRQVQGLGVRERASLERLTAPPRDLEEFVSRSGLSRRALLSLAEAGAFASLDVNRRDANWQLRGILRRLGDRLSTRTEADETAFPALSPAAEIVWDYRASGHSTRGHPMQLVRARLSELGVPDASQIRAMPDARRVRYVGMVICRQRPSTASGVTFFTLEDETGCVNVVVWRDLYERRRILARTSAMLGVTGRLQVAEGVTHLIAEDLWTPPLERPSQTPRPRDFH